jgi:hypothetical protein
MTVEQTLDALHKAASESDAERYFSLFSKSQREDDCCFIGTDATERWSLEEFKAYAMPHFREGNGWTYIPKPGHRHVYYSPDQTVAWFDELLDSQRFGVIARGTGVLLKEKEPLTEAEKSTASEDQVSNSKVKPAFAPRWKVAQYQLTVPVPNPLMEKVLGLMKEDDK